MTKSKDPQEQRDRLLREERKNPAGHVNDSITKAQSGMPDTSGMGWKDIGGVLLLVLIGLVVYILYRFFFI